MLPAAISAVTRRTEGDPSDEPSVSAAATAYPSMLELSNDGSATAAVTFSASTHPSASPSSRLVGARGVMADRMADWYDSTELSEPSTAVSRGSRPDVTAALRGTCAARE